MRPKLGFFNEDDIEIVVRDMWYCKILKIDK